MGYRTVVILSNDEQHIWAHDSKLGQKIQVAANAKIVGRRDGEFSYGRIGSVSHCDEQELVVIDSLAAVTIAQKRWSDGDTDDSVSIELLRRAAAELGYKLVPKD